MVARVRNLILNLTGKDFKEGVGEMRPSRKRLVKCSGINNNSLMLQQHFLPGSELNLEAVDKTSNISHQVAMPKRWQKLMPLQPSTHRWTFSEKWRMVHTNEIANLERKGNKAACVMAPKSSRVAYNAALIEIWGSCNCSQAAIVLSCTSTHIC